MHVSPLENKVSDDYKIMTKPFCMYAYGEVN